MSHPSIREYLRSAIGEDPSGPADAELLARFAATRDEAAFELLVWRHAALVQRVCKAVLRDHHAAEDAAQAAFLVLARKAHTFAGRGPVVGWLYRIARRIAVRQAKTQSRRQTSSSGLDGIPALNPDQPSSPDEVEALCAEVDRLPERYRIPVLLCFFEGLTHAEAARRTGWPLGTVAGRLARAKDLLARRLSRKGVGVCAVALGVPAGNFVGATAKAGVTFAAGPVVPGIEPNVTQLAEGAIRAMTATTWKLTAASVGAVLLAAAGAWGFATRPEPNEQGPPVASAPAVQPAARPGAQPAAGERAADAAQRRRSLNNLKQILLAIHNYHDVYGRLPGDITDKTGKPILSWRVAILPFIEEDNLYKQFKLDEPWDGDNNKKLLAKLPNVYRAGFEGKDETKTFYQVFAGPRTMFEPGKKMTLVTIVDGTSNTIAAVEAGPAVEWSKPADIAYDPKKPLPKLEGPFKNVLNVAHGDGAAHAFKRGIDEKTMRLLIERDDGIPIPDFADLKAKFPITGEEIKQAEELMKNSEKLIEGIAAELREQHKLLIEAARKKDPKQPFKGIDLEDILERHRDLQEMLKYLKMQTESIRTGKPIRPNIPEPAPTETRLEPPKPPAPPKP